MGPAGPPGGGGGGGLPNPIENWARRFGIHPGAAGVVATNSIHFCLNLVKKINDLPGGQINDPLLSGKRYSLPPSNSLVSVSEP